MRISSQNIHLGVKETDPVFGSVVPPIYSSSTFVFPSVKEAADRFAGRRKGMIYSRFTNPTVQALEKRLAALEEGEMALATASGMSAITLVMLHFLKKGDTLLAHRVLYGGTFELFSRILPRFGIKTFFADFTSFEEVERHLAKNPKILYFESPTNPKLEIIDIEKMAALGKKSKILTVFDNTFAPPPLQFPLKLGVDLVVHSLTKYLGGHSDLLGGAIIGRKELLEPLFRQSFIFFGPTLSPFTAYLALRGLTTLTVRIKQQCQNATFLAEFLSRHPKIKKVYYPSLPSHPQHQLAKRQMSDFGAVLSFEVKGGYQAAKKLVESLRLIHLAVSLGAVESLIEHPASMTHSEMTAEERKAAGISDNLVRLSVGIEDIQDLKEDLKQALKKN